LQFERGSYLENHHLMCTYIEMASAPWNAVSRFIVAVTQANLFP
jgi:hypothetical protein